jgi:hypothetical protein
MQDFEEDMIKKERFEKKWRTEIVDEFKHHQYRIQAHLEDHEARVLNTMTVPYPKERNITKSERQNNRQDERTMELRSSPTIKGSMRKEPIQENEDVPRNRKETIYKLKGDLMSKEEIKRSFRILGESRTQIFVEPKWFRRQ